MGKYPSFTFECVFNNTMTNFLTYSQDKYLDYIYFTTEYKHFEIKQEL